MYTLADLPRKGAAIHGPRTAVVFEDPRLTHDRLSRRINKAAHMLAELGLQRGERITVLSDNSVLSRHQLRRGQAGPQRHPSEHAPQRLGARVHRQRQRGRGDRRRRRPRAAGLDATEVVPAVRFGVSLENDHEGLTGCEDALSHASDHEPDPDCEPCEDDLAVLMDTGGTTGAPKGVMLSHRNVMTAAIANSIAMRFTQDDSTCFVLPIFDVAWWPILGLLLVGGKVVINRRLDLGEILRLIQDEQCTHMNSVPTIHGWLTEMGPVHSYDLSSLRLLTYAGSPIAVEVRKRAITVFGPIFAPGYGATETAGGPITIFDAEDHQPRIYRL